MDKSKIKQLVENCRSRSSNKVLESLLVIRNNVIRSGWGIQVLRECDGVEVLVSLLKRQKEDILELALSTLGNCCMDEQTSLTVGELKGTSEVVTIVKALSGDRLVGRACRLLGNLAQQTSNAEQLMAEGAVPVLVTILSNTDKTTSVQTLTMAVRAIRLLWMNGKQQEEMLSCGAVRAVAVLLCTECEAAGLIGSSEPNRGRKDKDRELLFKGLLKCLGQFTTVAHHKCAEQILGEGPGYRCLVVLCREYEELASKCLVNLCYVGPCRPILGTAGAVECLVNLIKSQTVPEYPECYLNAVCLLCREAVNRAKLRQCGGLSILLEAARNTTQLSRHTTALRALLQFVFDDISFQMLLNQGLIGMIEEQLKDYVRTMRCEHQVKSTEKGGADATKVEVHHEEDAQDGSCEGLKIVIERDNMIIGFNDAYSISEEEDSDTDHPVDVVAHGRKRTRKSISEKSVSLHKMAKYDWSSSGISCEPKLDTSHPLPNVSPMSGYSPTGSGSHSPDRSRPNHVYVRTTGRLDGDRSPETAPSEGCSYYSGGQWSPGSPNSLCYSSPYDDDSSDSEKSERYSPVCSDVDEGDSNETKEGEREGHMTSEMDDLMIDDETLSIQELQLEENSTHQSKSHRARCLLVLLSRASHSDSGIENLASPALLLALISYILNARNPANRAARILARIISYATHIIRLLKHRLVLHLYKMLHEPKHTECKQCSQLKILSTRLMTQLTMLAESDYGIGEITYQLLKGETCVKQSLALTLPYIIKAQRPLKKFLINCKAFELLFNMMSCGREPLEHSVPSLAQLARSLHVKDPKTLEHNFQNQSQSQYHPQLGNLQPEDVVSFVLDDSTCVQADKQFLCQQSDVFNAMFTGAFKESSERSVKLKSVSKESLEYLLTLLHYGANNQDSCIETFPLPECLGTSLETLLLADKFLMEKLKSLLFSAIVQFKLKWETARKIYVWSLEEGMGLLCVEAVAYILAGEMSDAHRLRVVSSIMDTHYKHQLLEDIKSVLIRHFK